MAAKPEKRLPRCNIVKNNLCKLFYNSPEKKL